MDIIFKAWGVLAGMVGVISSIILMKKKLKLEPIILFIISIIVVL